MRKIVLSLLAVAFFGSGAALAQSGYWVGLSGGWPGAGLHFGVENAFAGLDLRGTVNYAYSGSFGVSADVLYGLGVDTGSLPLDVYVGGGVGLGFGGTLGVIVNAFGGVEYRLSEVGFSEGGIFLELGPAIGVVPGFVFGIGGKLGFNYHF